MLAQEQKKTYELVKHAAKHGGLALVECQDRATGKQVAVLCGVNEFEDGEVEIVPLARLMDDPYEELNPPNPDGGFFGEGEEGEK